MLECFLARLSCESCFGHPRLEVHVKHNWGRPLKKASHWDVGYNHKQNMEDSTRAVVNAAAGHGWVVSSRSCGLAMHA